VEKELFPRAKRRADLGAHRSTVLLWTGIIQSAEAVQVEARQGLRVVVEHRYFRILRTPLR